MKLSSQTIVLSVALAATAVDASNRYLVRNRKAKRNLIKVETTEHTSLEEIVEMDDTKLFRELMGTNGDMSMSMPVKPSGSSGSSSSDGGSSSSGGGSSSSGGSSGNGSSDSESDSSSDGSGSGSESDSSEAPAASPVASPVLLTPQVGTPTADDIVTAPSEAPAGPLPGSTPLDAPTGELDAPTGEQLLSEEETDASPSSSSRRNIAMAATTITIALTVVPFIV